MRFRVPVPIISLKNVYYAYPHAPEGAAAMSGVTLAVEEGEFIGIVGANGSGKSTLARLLSGLLQPSRGEVTTDGTVAGGCGNQAGDSGMQAGGRGNQAGDRGKQAGSRGSQARIRELAGLVLQNPDSQIVASTVEDDIAFGLENLGLPPEEIGLRVDEAVAQFGLATVRAREPHWLSGGQKQCVVLAGIMAMAPRLLVLDEPTAMLDPRSRRRFRELVGELHMRGTTVVYITNVMEEIVTAPRLLALSGGWLVFDGSPADFFSNRELLEETGAVPPLPVRLGAALAARGHDVPLSLTLEDLVRQVCASS